MYRLELSRWRRRRFISTWPRTAVEGRADDPSDQLDLRVVMEQALRRITAAQRAVLVLRFYEDLSEADTAAALGCSIGTVKSQTHKALDALRAAPDLAELVGRRLSTDV